MYTTDRRQTDAKLLYRYYGYLVILYFKGKLKVELGLGLYSYYYVIHVKFQQNDLILNSIT